MLVNCQQRENSRTTLSDWPSSLLCSSQCGWPQLELVGKKCCQSGFYQPINFQFIFWKTPVTLQTLTTGRSSPTGTVSTFWWWPCPPSATETSTAWPPLVAHSRQEKSLVDRIATTLLFRCFSSPLVSPSLPLPSPRSSSCLDSAANMVEPSRMKGGETIVETSHDDRFRQASHSGVWAHHLWVGHLLPQGLSSSWPRKGAEESVRG